jgi:outer membrane protein OmpA-like peptidoglycan-associated protein
MKKIVLAALSFFFVSSIAYSQIEEQLKERIMDANYFFYNTEYDKALPIYRELLEKDPNNANLNFKAGRCFQLMPFEAGRSISYMEKAVKDLSRTYVEGSYRERKAPISALYHLAEAYHQNKYFDEGIEFYQRFRDSLDVTDIYNISIVERQLLSCKTAKEIASKPVPVEIYNVGNIINTKDADFNPCITADGNTLFFTRLMPISTKGVITDYTQRIFFSNRIDEERWMEPIDITEQLQTKGRCAVVSVNADGTMLILQQNTWGQGGITDLRDGTLLFSKRPTRTSAWNPAERFNKNINERRSNQTHAAISADGKKLYFTSNRLGGYGGLDIYVSELIAGDWGPAKNLGKTINTAHNEETPFILADGKTLYFASEGHYNMGGFDIFSSRMDDNGKWSEPVNLGYPINSPGDNIFFAPTGNGKMAYYAQARHEGYFTFGDMDIYELILPTYDDYARGVPTVVKGTIEFDDFKPVDGSTKLLVIDKHDHVVKDMKPKDDGSYEVSLFQGEYTFRFVRTGYHSIEKKVFIERTVIDRTIHINAEMYPDEVEDKRFYVIRNIYFDDNDFSLNREALIQIERLKRIMLENPSLYIEVIGHTDTRGSREYNLELSRKRSRTVIEYLVEQGIEESRFVSTAAGFDKVAVPDRTVEGTSIDIATQLNRRVEVRIIKTEEAVEILVDNTPAEKLLEKFNRFSVQVAESNTNIPQEKFANLGEENKVNRSLVKPSTYLYYFGEYTTKADATKALNMAISKGYKDAKIIDYFTLNQNSEFTITNPVPYTKRYTIQLQALAREQVFTTNDILLDATVYQTEDEYYRYTYKEYDVLEDAQKDLMYLMDKGFPNAFIIEVTNLKQ